MRFKQNEQSRVISAKDSVKVDLILLSGKRYSGKDTLAKLLKKIFQAQDLEAVIRSTALAVKTEFCRQRNLDLSRFLNDRNHKERYRSQLTNFLQNSSKEDNLQNFIALVKGDLAERKMVIVSDIRTLYDLQELRKVFSAAAVRLEASEQSRSVRGWRSSVYDEGLLENELNDEHFDYYIENNGSLAEFRLAADQLVGKIRFSL